MQKPTFTEVGVLMILGFIWHDLGGLGNNFHDFRCHGDWLETARRPPQILSTRLEGGKWFGRPRAPVTTIPGSLKPTRDRDPGTDWES